MKTGLGLICAAAWAGSAGAQPASASLRTVPPSPSPSYQVVSHSAPPPTVRCREGEAVLRSGSAPPPTVSPVRRPVPPVADADGPVAPAVAPQRPGSVTHTFDVTAEGRVAGLRRAPEPHSSYDTEDHPIQAAIVAWSFAPGRAFTGCRHTTERLGTPLESADRPLLLQLMAETRPGVGRREVWRRALPPEGDCLRGKRPEPRLLAYPATDRIPSEAGRPHWVWLDYDLNAAGRPVGARVAASSGNRALEAEALRALNASRFAPGARRGCSRNFGRTPSDLPAPERPNISTFARPGDTCPNVEGSGDRLKLVDGALIYPLPFRERAVEGWAVVRFDLASWGAVGPVEVVAAEPAGAFGQAAQNLAHTARAEPGPGWRGCLQPIVFKMADPDEQFDFTRDLTLR